MGVRKGDLLYSRSTRTQFMIENDETNAYVVSESDMSFFFPDHSCTGWMIECERSKTNLQKMQHKTATNTLWYGEHIRLRHCKHLNSWGRITQTIDIPSKTHNISQWNRCSTHLRNWYPSNQMRSVEWIQLTGITFHGSIYLWLVMKEIICILHTKAFVFPDSVLCFGKMNEITFNQILFGKTSWRGSKVHHNTALDTIDGEPMEFEWDIFLAFITLQLFHKIQELLSRLSIITAKWIGRLLSSYRCSTTSHGDLRTTRMRVKCHLSVQKKRSRTVLILRTWIKEKMVLY